VLQSSRLHFSLIWACTMWGGLPQARSNKAIAQAARAAGAAFVLSLISFRVLIEALKGPGAPLGPFFFPGAQVKHDEAGEDAACLRAAERSCQAASRTSSQRINFTPLSKLFVV
jgi:isopentenyl diphosphate isomerase/L-lactate dehydrogenase-like FMN-dependent dehydrogenase